MLSLQFSVLTYSYLSFSYYFVPIRMNSYMDYVRSKRILYQLAPGLLASSSIFLKKLLLITMQLPNLTQTIRIISLEKHPDETKMLRNHPDGER